GEIHATPEQTEIGTPPRAAANRPVRRERADHRRHAGLVRTPHGDAGGVNHPDNEADPGPCRQAPDRFAEGVSDSRTRAAPSIWSAKRSSTFASRRLIRFCTTGRAARCNTPCAIAWL